MSVPFEEPEPMFAGHHRRYEMEDLERDFPDAELTLLYRPKMPWALMEEWFGPGESPGRVRLAALEARTRKAPESVPRLHGNSFLRSLFVRLPKPLRSFIKRVVVNGGRR